MLRIIKNEFGKELGLFEFDYLGEHTALDMVLLNAKIIMFDKGLQILNGISGDSLFIEWNEIIFCSINGHLKINLTTHEGIIKLEKVKQEKNISQFIKILEDIAPQLEIKYISETDNVSSIERKRFEKRLKQQEHRVNEFVKSCGSKNDSDIEDAWCEYLEHNLQFPFEAQIIDEPGPLEVGDIIKVKGIDGVFDLYGIIVNARVGRKKYSFPLCLLELVEKNSKNYQLVDDYNFWFCSR